MFFDAKVILSSIGAIVASNSSSTDGTIFLESSLSAFYVSSCSEETVTISRGSSKAVQEQQALIDNVFKPGHILAYLGGNDDGSICSRCHTMFRKIASQSKYDANTFHTEYLSFADVFPDNVYDDSLADALIEPLLQCHDKKYRRVEEEQSIIEGVPVPSPYDNIIASENYYDYERLLGETPEPSSEPSDRFTFAPTPGPGPSINTCEWVVLWLYIFLVAICCFIPVIGWLFSIFVIFPVFFSIYYWGCGNDGRVFSNTNLLNGFFGNRDRLLAEEFSRSMQYYYGDFPGSAKENWMKLDMKGNCVYTNNCNVGFIGGGPSDCFWCSSSSSSSGTCPDSVCHHESSKNGMLQLPSFTTSAFDFSDACNIQDFCYSSNLNKETCDKNFYKIMKDSCSSSSASPLDKWPIGSIMDSSNVLDVKFPLGESDLTQNCDVMAVLYYLSAKGFGYEAHKDQQLKQHQYEESSCNNRVEMN